MKSEMPPIQIYDGARYWSKAFGRIVVEEVSYDAGTKELVANCKSAAGEELTLSQKYIREWLA